ncbi:MAG: universal stress protein [Myxococcales bacterium]|nr:universal stress protein [Myxococcales bacterium]
MKHILVPTDFSPDSERAILLACILAKALSAPIRLFHVFSGRDEPLCESNRTLEAEAENIRAQGVTCRPLLAELMPNTRIANETESADVRLLVMGTHARHGLQRAVWGSFTERALREAACPVISVNPQARIPEEVRVVVVGMDGSKLAEAAFEEVVRVAPGLGVRRLVLAHAAEEEGDNFSASRWISVAREAGLEVEVETDRGAPLELILRVAAKHGADLIALGTHGRSGVRRSLFGSVAEAVLRRAPCPVLTRRG